MGPTRKLWGLRWFIWNEHDGYNGTAAAVYGPDAANARLRRNAATTNLWSANAASIPGTHATAIFVWHASPSARAVRTTATHAAAAANLWATTTTLATAAFPILNIRRYQLNSSFYR